jgi:polar amino acid transport system permease protein
VTVTDYLPFILEGFLVTLLVFALGSLVWMPVACVLALGRLSRLALVRLAAGFVIELFRGTSALVQLFWAFYVLPIAGITLSPLLTAVLVLGLCEGSYAAEIVRGAIRGVPKGQVEAAKALGMGPAARFRRVVMPQALPVIVPQFGNCLIEFLKFTSLVSLVTVSDVTFRALAVRNTIGETTAIFGLILLLYCAGSLVISTGTVLLERRLKRKRGELGPRSRMSLRDLVSVAMRVDRGRRA